MIELKQHIDIAAPPAVVWPIMADVVTWHEWTASITRIEPLGDADLVVGHRFRVHQPKLPAAIWQVREVLPDKGFAWVSKAPGALIEGHHWIEPRPGGCRVELSIRYGGVVGTMIGWMFRSISVKYIGMEAVGLKRRSEAAAEGARGKA